MKGGNGQREKVDRLTEDAYRLCNDRARLDWGLRITLKACGLGPVQIDKIITDVRSADFSSLQKALKMDNQHKKITGYRDLSKTEIDLMNEIKAKAEELKALIDKAEDALHKLEDPVINQDGLDDVDRYLELARTNSQQGFMWFVRAVERPQSF